MCLARRSANSFILALQEMCFLCFDKELCIKSRLSKVNFYRLVKGTCKALCEIFLYLSWRNSKYDTIDTAMYGLYDMRSREPGIRFSTVARSLDRKIYRLNLISIFRRHNWIYMVQWLLSDIGLYVRAPQMDTKFSDSCLDEPKRKCFRLQYAVAVAREYIGYKIYMDTTFSSIIRLQG